MYDKRTQCTLLVAANENENQYIGRGTIVPAWPHTNPLIPLRVRARLPPNLVYFEYLITIQHQCQIYQDFYPSPFSHLLLAPKNISLIHAHHPHTFRVNSWRTSICTAGWGRRESLWRSLWWHTHSSGWRRRETSRWRPAESLWWCLPSLHELWWSCEVVWWRHSHSHVSLHRWTEPTSSSCKKYRWLNGCHAC